VASQSFVVNINSSVSDQFPLHQGVPQGSVFGPLLFILYTTPPSTLISESSTCGHHFYADNNQLFISFAASDFSANILHLKVKVKVKVNQNTCKAP